MSRHVVGFRPPDETWRKHKAVWDACAAADVDPPKETAEFFNWEEPDDAGVTVRLQDTPAVSEYREEMCEGFSVDVTKLPKDVTVVRFYTAC